MATKKIKIKPTKRGFGYGEFYDANGYKCSIQVSSAWQAEKLLWLGFNKLEVSIGMPWRQVTEAEIAQKFGATAFCSSVPSVSNAPAINANTRMHLTQSQVKELLPLLTKFAYTGEL